MVSEAAQGSDPEDWPHRVHSPKEEGSVHRVCVVIESQCNAIVGKVLIPPDSAAQNQTNYVTVNINNRN